MPVHYLKSKFSAAPDSQNGRLRQISVLALAREFEQLGRSTAFAQKGANGPSTDRSNRGDI